MYTRFNYADMEDNIISNILIYFRCDWSVVIYLIINDGQIKQLISNQLMQLRFKRSMMLSPSIYVFLSPFTASFVSFGMHRQHVIRVHCLIQSRDHRLSHDFVLFPLFFLYNKTTVHCLVVCFQCALPPYCPFFAPKTCSCQRSFTVLSSASSVHYRHIAHCLLQQPAHVNNRSLSCRLLPVCTTAILPIICSNNLLMSTTVHCLVVCFQCALPPYCPFFAPTTCSCQRSFTVLSSASSVHCRRIAHSLLQQPAHVNDRSLSCRLLPVCTTAILPILCSNNLLMSTTVHCLVVCFQCALPPYCPFFPPTTCSCQRPFTVLSSASSVHYRHIAHCLLQQPAHVNDRSLSCRLLPVCTTAILPILCSNNLLMSTTVHCLVVCFQCALPPYCPLFAPTTCSCRRPFTVLSSASSVHCRHIAHSLVQQPAHVNDRSLSCRLLPVCTTAILPILCSNNLLMSTTVHCLVVCFQCALPPYCPFFAPTTCSCQRPFTVLSSASSVHYRHIAHCLLQQPAHVNDRSLSCRLLPVCTAAILPIVCSNNLLMSTIVHCLVVCFQCALPPYCPLFASTTCSCQRPFTVLSSASSVHCRHIAHCLLQQPAHVNDRSLSCRLLPVCTTAILPIVCSNNLLMSTIVHCIVVCFQCALPPYCPLFAPTTCSCQRPFTVLSSASSVHYRHIAHCLLQQPAHVNDRSLSCRLLPVCTTAILPIVCSNNLLMSTTVHCIVVCFQCALPPYCPFFAPTTCSCQRPFTVLSSASSVHYRHITHSLVQQPAHVNDRSLSCRLLPVCTTAILPIVCSNNLLMSTTVHCLVVCFQCALPPYCPLFAPTTCSCQRPFTVLSSASSVHYRHIAHCLLQQPAHVNDRSLYCRLLPVCTTAILPILCSNNLLMSTTVHCLVVCFQCALPPYCPFFAPTTCSCQRPFTVLSSASSVHYRHIAHSLLQQPAHVNDRSLSCRLLPVCTTAILPILCSNNLLMSTTVHCLVVCFQCALPPYCPLFAPTTCSCQRSSYHPFAR